MSRPTPEELTAALQEAARMREHDEDPLSVGKSLLNLNYRLNYLERVLYAAKEFLHTGLAPQQQIDLQRAIEQAEKASHFVTDKEEKGFL